MGTPLRQRASRPRGVRNFSNSHCSAATSPSSLAPEPEASRLAPGGKLRCPQG